MTLVPLTIKNMQIFPPTWMEWRCAIQNNTQYFLRSTTRTINGTEIKKTKSCNSPVVTTP